jgi:hypothetical protein
VSHNYARIGALVVAVLVLVILLASCGTAAAGDDEGETNVDRIYENHVQMDDGRTVTCLSLAYQNGAGGLSCDWDNAR